MERKIAKTILDEKQISCKWYNRKTIVVEGHSKIKEIYINKINIIGVKYHTYKNKYVIKEVPKEPIFDKDYQDNAESIVIETLERINYNGIFF